MTKNTKTTLWIVLGLVVIGGLVGWTIHTRSNKQKGAAVEFDTVSTRTIEERVTASGRIFPVTEVAISSDVSGEVIELLVKEGDSVRSGQLLARIDPDAIESQVLSGRAAVNAARATAANAEASIDQFKASKKQLEAQLVPAELALKRTKQLVAEGLASTAELETAESTVQALVANIAAADANVRAAQQSAKASRFQVESSQAQLSELRTNLRRTNVFAPMTGVLSQLSIEEGERVVGTIQMAGTEMMRIADLSRMEVQVEVSENDIPRVTLGDYVEIEVDAYLDRTFSGKVAEISNSAANLTGATAIQSLTSDQVTNFVVKINIDPTSYADLVSIQRPYPFRPGMSAAVEIRTEVEDGATAVPIAAVTAREKLNADDLPASERDELEEIIWVATAADTVERRVVKTGIQDRDYIQVITGIKVGERVVIGPYSQVSKSLDGGDAVYEESEEEEEDEDDA